jgi:hypothetical protein
MDMFDLLSISILIRLFLSTIQGGQIVLAKQLGLRVAWNVRHLLQEKEKFFTGIVGIIFINVYNVHPLCHVK